MNIATGLTAGFALVVLTALPPVERDPANPLLAPAASGWDSDDVADPAVLATPEGLRLYYDGNGAGGYAIGTALSVDGGRTWTRHAQPVVARQNHPVQWENLQVTAPSVLDHAGHYWMWYSATASTTFAAGYQIGLATSADGVNWVRYNGGDAPVLPLGPSGGGDGFSVADPHVLYDQAAGQFVMWYSGALDFAGYPLYSIWRATSPDGIHWSNRRQVLAESVMCAAPAVHHDGTRYRMAYAVMTPMAPTRFTEIRQRFSNDGIDWGGPGDYETLLTLAPGSEQNQLYSPWWLAIPGTDLQLFYCGHDPNGRWHIGRAFEVTNTSVAEYRRYR